MLHVSALTVKYGQAVALEDATLVVDEGEVVCLLGSNGAGKTTLLRAVMGLAPLAHGTVTFAGSDISRLSTERRASAGISLVPEGRGIFGGMTVSENLLMGGYSRGSAGVLKDDLDHVYSLFPRLHERQSQLAGTLSGGEQQMLAIGRGLMSRPKCMLFDEPSMGLAPVIVEHVFSIIDRIHQEGMSILLVEQNANVALEIADRYYVLKQGHIVKSGEASDALESESLEQAYLGV